MKSTRKVVAMYATAACLSVAASIFSGAALAQSDQPEQGMTRASMRRADHKLEQEVRLALAHAKVDTTDILVRARGSKVAVIGYVPDQNMIPVVGDTAGQVTGVTSVDNRVVLFPIGDQAED